MTTSADQIQGTSAQPQAAGAAASVKVEEGQQAQQNGNGNAKSTSGGEKKKDPYYGHEEVAKMSARFIMSLFTCPNVPPATNPPTPQPPLAHFIAYALHRTRLPHFVTLAGLLLLQRLKTRYPSAKGSSGHRLFISAFMIASKVICDDTYSNASWCIVAQKMFTLKEMNQMEREMCGYLEWNLNTSASEIEIFEAKLKADFSTMAVAAKRAALLAQQQAAANGSTSSPASDAATPRVTVPLPQRTNKSRPMSRNGSTNSIATVPSGQNGYQVQRPAFPLFPADGMKRVGSPLNGVSTPAGPSRVASVPSIPTYFPPMSAAANAMPRLSADIPSFHPGSNAPIAGSSPLSMSARRGSKQGKEKGWQLGPGMNGRSNSSWSLNGHSGISSRAASGAIENFSSGELGTSGSGAGTYASIDGNAEEREDDYAMAVSPGPSSVDALSTTWPKMGGFIGSANRMSSSYLQPPPSCAHSSSTHLHNSPHPSLTNDNSNQSSPDSQLCQTPSPIATSSAPYEIPRYNHGKAQPVPIQRNPQRSSVASYW